MELYQISTTAFPEEDLLLLSNASEEEITEALELIVTKERAGQAYYFNFEYVDYLKVKYPTHTFIYIESPHQIML